METLMLRSPLVALFAGLLALTPTTVFKICKWNAGTMAIEPWRVRSAAAVQKVSQALRTWMTAIWGSDVALACAAALLALLVAHLSAGHNVVAFATVLPLATLRANHAQLLREAEAFKKDGAFVDDQARASFDAKMTEVEAVAAQIRTAEATPPPASQPTVTTEQRAQILADERARTEGIQTAVRVAGLDAPLAADMVQRGITLDAARVEIFAKLAERSNAQAVNGHIQVGEDARDKSLRGMTNWMLIKGGVAGLVARATKTEQSAIDAGEFRGMTLLDMARELLERRGVSVRGLDKMSIASRAFVTRATQSTSDFAVLLENVMGKVLQAAYAIQPDTWTKFCAQSTVSDFRAHNRYRMSSFGALDTLTENGEFKNKTITDAEKNTITASTKGNIIAVSRQMIVNDDLGAFMKLLTMLGRAAALSVEVDVYALLAQNAGLGPTMGDGNTLFHANHGNISTGAALAAAALDADRVAMATQKDVSGNDFIDLRPAVLALPVGLGGQAKVINQSQYDPDTIANKSQMKPNIVVGLFREIVDTPRLTGTRRYLFADPAIAPVIEVAFLEGQTAPVMETKDGWRTDGAEMKVRFDYGVAGVDFRGAVTNAGA
jgi:hypothetical protein